MKKLIFAVFCFFGLVATSSAAEPTAIKEFELESNFCTVVAQIIQDPDVLSTSEIHQKQQLKRGIVYKKDKGLIFYDISRNQFVSRGEKLWFKSQMALNQKSLVIVSKLDSESSKLQNSVLQMEFHKDGNGTKVKYKLWVKADASEFFLRIRARVELKHMEEKIRKRLGESLLE